MKINKDKLLKFFSDEFIAEDVAEMSESSATDEFTKEIIVEIISGSSPANILNNLFAKARKSGFIIDIPLSDCFFLISELTNATQSERDFALDMSLYLSENEDTRGPEFNPETAFTKIQP